MHPSASPAGPDDPRCTCHLLRSAARRVTQVYDDALRPAGLKTSQFSLLATLRHAEALTLGELAERLSMDRTTLTRNLRPLQQAGWIERVPDPVDRRRIHLVVTAAGRATLAHARPLWRDAQHAFRARLGAPSVMALHTALDDTLEHLR
jgi:DNA-binding MarR family transcriptional regulator